MRHHWRLLHREVMWSELCLWNIKLAVMMGVCCRKHRPAAGRVFNSCCEHERCGTWSHGTEEDLVSNVCCSWRRGRTWRWALAPERLSGCGTNKRNTAGRTTDVEGVGGNRCSLLYVDAVTHTNQNIYQVLDNQDSKSPAYRKQIRIQHYANIISPEMFFSEI